MSIPPLRFRRFAFLPPLVTWDRKRRGDALASRNFNRPAVGDADRDRSDAFDGPPSWTPRSSTARASRRRHEQLSQAVRDGRIIPDDADEA